jgi:hypothetical protein
MHLLTTTNVHLDLFMIQTSYSPNLDNDRLVDAGCCGAHHLLKALGAR